MFVAAVGLFCDGAMELAATQINSNVRYEPDESPPKGITAGSAFRRG